MRLQFSPTTLLGRQGWETRRTIPWGHRVTKECNQGMQHATNTMANQQHFGIDLGGHGGPSFRMSCFGNRLPFIVATGFRLLYLPRPCEVSSSYTFAFPQRQRFSPSLESPVNPIDQGSATARGLLLGPLFSVGRVHSRTKATVGGVPPFSLVC